MNKSNHTNSYPCPECNVGEMRVQKARYKTAAGGKNWTIPGVEQESCTHCDLVVITPSGSERIDSWLDEKLEAITREELLAFLGKYNLTQKGASEILGIGEKCLSRWIRGPQRVSTSMSRYIRLLAENEDAFWQLRERQSNKGPATRKVLPPTEKELLSKADYNSLRKLEFLPKTMKPNQRHAALCELIQFPSLEALLDWSEEIESSVAAFKDTNQRYSNINGAIWLRLGMLAAGTIPCARYDRSQLEKATDKLRRCTKQDVAEAFRLAQDQLSRAGVALVVVPKLKGSAYRGCTRLVTSEKAVIIHALKFKNVSQFWRTLFHEIAHLILHIESPADKFLEYEDRKGNQKEQEADNWAEELLVHGEKRITFLARHPGAPVEEIRKIAKSLNISPAIFVESIAGEMVDAKGFYIKCRNAGIFPILTNPEIEEMLAGTKKALMETRKVSDWGGDLAWKPQLLRK